MRIYFTRHGESEANVLHIISNRDLKHRLTLLGRDQAQNLASYLQQFAISQIYSSPIFRAVETSTIIANRLQMSYEVVSALREFDCGIVEGCSDEAAWQQWQCLRDSWLIEKCYDAHIEGGESYNDMRQRFLPFICELIQIYGHTTEGIVRVSHGGIYTMMLPLIVKNVDSNTLVKGGFGYTSCLVAELQRGGLTCIEWHGHLYQTEDERSKIKNLGEGYTA